MRICNGKTEGDARHGHLPATVESKIPLPQLLSSLRTALAGTAISLTLATASLILLPLGIVGCQSCQRSTPLAELLKKSGKVDRDKAPEQDKWLLAEQGATFDIGDAIRTATHASAELKLDDGSVLGLQEQTLVRFLDRQPGQREQSLDLVMGEASLLAPEGGSLLKTAFGLARLEGGTRIQLQRSGDSLRYRVMVGRAQVENPEGGVVQISDGQTVVATLGEAVLELADSEEAKKQIAEEKEEEPAPPAILEGPIQAQIRGSGVRVKAPGQSTPQRVSAGSMELSAGSVVEVTRKSSVSVAQGDQRAELSDGTFIVGAGNQLVEASSGSYTVSSERSIRIKVPGGYITTTGGTASITRVGDESTRVTAKSGSLKLSGTTSEKLQTGDEGQITSDGTVTVKGRGLDHADVNVSAGQTIVVHDPAPPTAVGFGFGELCTRGVIHLKGQKSALPGEDLARGEKWVSLAMGPGRVEYTLRCIGDDSEESDVKAKGVVTVLHDAGSRPVPRKAPSTTVDVNGRAYTVLYQNHLPRVTARWSGAPAAGSYTIHRTSPGAQRTHTSSSPSYTFASGVLGEGTHTFYFEGGGRVSRRTSVTIRFDNATPTASLQTPAGSSVGPGGSLRLVGTGLPGWTVTVDGKSVAQDAEGRFSVTTTMPESGRAATVQLSHPTRGTHVYLRRPVGAL